MAKQIEVKILGRDFSIACPENEEDSLMKSINFLNHKIDEVQASGSIIGGDKTIIMAALNITHEYLNKNNNADADVKNLSYKNKLTDFNKLLDSILD